MFIFRSSVQNCRFIREACWEWEVSFYIEFPMASYSLNLLTFGAAVMPLPSSTMMPDY